MRVLFSGRVAWLCLWMCFCQAVQGQHDSNAGGGCTASSIEVEIERGEKLLSESLIDSAFTILQKASVCARTLEDKKWLARTLLGLGRIELRRLGPRDTPTKLLLESLSIYSELGDEYGITFCHLQLGVLHYDIKNYEAAVRHFQNVLVAGAEGRRFRSVALYLLALSYSELPEYTLAEETFDKAAAEVNDSDSLFHLQILTFKGKMYDNKGEHEKAIALFKQGLTRYKHIIQNEEYAPIHAFLSTALVKSGFLREAIGYAKIAYRLSMASSSSSIYLREAENTLQLAYHKTGQHDSAYYFLNALRALDDSVLNVQVLQRVAQMNGEFEFDQQRKLQQAEQALIDQVTKQKMERQRWQRNLLLFGLLFVLGFAVVFFRQRTKISQERDRSETLLLNILPEEIAVELKAKGSAEARYFDHSTILFSDFKNFTALSAIMSPAELVRELNHCFHAFDHIMGRYRIEKIKTIGDAYMAAGGLPDPQHGSPADVIHAALDMQAYMAIHQTERQAAEKPYFEMRIGIHTGPVVAGIVGAKKFQYDIWGDTVNMASRMESAGETGKVNISASTYEAVRDAEEFVFTFRGGIEAKGKGKVDMWFVSRKEGKQGVTNVSTEK